MLLDALIFLAAAVVCVPLAKWAGLGAVLGYLIAGCLIGPWALGFVSDPESILHFSEFGVVLMLFLIGLELDVRQVIALRKPVFGGGSVQKASCGLALAGGLFLLGLGWQAALIAGFALAISSTAIAVQNMSERNLLNAPVGRNVIAVSIFQDIAAIPLMAAVPLFAVGVAGAAAATTGSPWLAVAKGLGAIVAVLVIGSLVMPPLMRLIAKSNVREIFTALALLLVIGISELMTLAGLSMALGAFIAGVLLAQSEYRQALQADIEPFKGLLLGLFFIAVGMSIDFGVVRGAPLLLAAMVVGFVLIKALVVAAIAPVLGGHGRERWLYAALLAPGSEFAFVVFGVARDARVMPGQWEPLLTAAVALSMACAPLLLIAYDKLVARQARAQRDADAVSDAGDGVIIAGFGRYGQIVGRMLLAHGLKPTVLDHDPDNIDAIRQFGYKVFYGDATRRDLLEAAGIARARLLVVAIDDVEDGLQLVDLVRGDFPKVTIVARARNVRHWLQLTERGVTSVQRETFESALRSGRDALQVLGLAPYEARQFADAFRRQNEATLQALLPHFRDQEKTVAIAKSGRQELEENLRRDREVRNRALGAGSWGDDAYVKRDADGNRAART
jgi:glutathione-regulated potassium-efflux system ancillary protein KefC